MIKVHLKNNMIRRLGSMMLWSLKKGAGNNMTNSFLDTSVTSTRSVLHSQLLLKRNLNTNKMYPNIEVNTLDAFRQQATPEELQMLEQVKLEYETYLREGMDVPSKLSEENYLRLISTPHVNKRKKYLFFLSKKELLKQHDKVRKAEKMKAKEEMRQNDPHYELTSLITKHRNRKDLLAILEYRVWMSALYEDPIIIDGGFFDVMSYKENSLCVQQIHFLMSQNRKRAGKGTPVPIILCNLKPTVEKSNFYYMFQQRLLGGKESILLTEKSYLDLYPREKLVYLSPDSPRYYNPFGQDSDKIPIIGGIVDLETSGKQTFTRAKTEKIPTRRLPLDLHDKKYYGSKALPLIQIFDYVMALRQTGSLDIAKEAIAQRKFKQPEPGSKRQKNREY